MPQATLFSWTRAAVAVVAMELSPAAQKLIENAAKDIRLLQKKNTDVWTEAKKFDVSAACINLKQLLESLPDNAENNQCYAALHCLLNKFLTYPLGLQNIHGMQAKEIKALSERIIRKLQECGVVDKRLTDTRLDGIKFVEIPSMDEAVHEVVRGPTRTKTVIEVNISGTHAPILPDLVQSLPPELRKPHEADVSCNFSGGSQSSESPDKARPAVVVDQPTEAEKSLEGGTRPSTTLSSEELLRRDIQDGRTTQTIQETTLNASDQEPRPQLPTEYNPPVTSTPLPGPRTMLSDDALMMTHQPVIENLPAPLLLMRSDESLPGTGQVTVGEPLPRVSVPMEITQPEEPMEIEPSVQPQVEVIPVPMEIDTVNETALVPAQVVEEPVLVPVQGQQEVSHRQDAVPRRTRQGRRASSETATIPTIPLPPMETLITYEHKKLKRKTGKQRKQKKSVGESPNYNQGFLDNFWLGDEGLRNLIQQRAVQRQKETDMTVPLVNGLTTSMESTNVPDQVSELLRQSQPTVIPQQDQVVDMEVSEIQPMIGVLDASDQRMIDRMLDANERAQVQRPQLPTTAPDEVDIIRKEPIVKWLQQKWSGSGSERLSFKNLDLPTSLPLKLAHKILFLQLMELMVRGYIWMEAAPDGNDIFIRELCEYPTS